MTNGKVYLIPTPLGDVHPLETLPLSVIKIVERLTHFIVENEKSARRFIKKIAPQKSQESLCISLLNKFVKEQESERYLDICFRGISVGILSEVGAPAIADPGASIVKLAHRLKLKVVPLVGPSSILLAMMASGMNGQNFAFNGYLPIDEKERKKTIKELEKRSKERNQSQLFIETPYRNNKLFSSLLSVLNGSTELCIALDIGLATEDIRTLSVNNWKTQKTDMHKRPGIFIIHY